MKNNTLADTVGHTPLVQLQHMVAHTQATVLAKLEGNNPAGSIKDRPAFQMIIEAEKRGTIHPGDTLIEATSGNTGIALAMAATMRGYKMILLMPENSTQERKDAMAAYGAELILTKSMEAARDQAKAMADAGKGTLLDQFNNPDNKLAHYLTTGPEIWAQTQGKITHFVSSMGTTGTISGTAKFLKEQNPNVQIIGLQPDEKSSIPGIRRWPAAYMPSIFEADLIDQVIDINQTEAEEFTRKMAREEGIFAGVSSGAAAMVATQLAEQNPQAVIVCIICDRGDRYLSSGLFSPQE